MILLKCLKKHINDGIEIEIHHGDCIGADKDFHDICTKLLIKTIIIHPPNCKTMRAFCKSEQIREEKDYLTRNKDIVNDSDILIACPLDEKEQLRSGTWSTIRYAKKLNKKIILCIP